MENGKPTSFAPCVTLHVGKPNANDLKLVGCSLTPRAVRAVVAELRREWIPEADNPVIAGRIATLDAIVSMLPAEGEA